MEANRIRESSLSRARKLPVILDTSALLYPFQKRVDFVKGIQHALEGRYELVVTEGTISELRKLQGGNKPLLAIASRKALDFAMNLRSLRSERGLPEDESIIKLAQRLDAAVATADSSLRSKLKKMGMTVIFVSKGKRIMIDNKPLC